MILVLFLKYLGLHFRFGTIALYLKQTVTWHFKWHSCSKYKFRKVDLRVFFFQKSQFSKMFFMIPRSMQKKLKFLYVRYGPSSFQSFSAFLLINNVFSSLQVVFQMCSLVDCFWKENGREKERYTYFLWTLCRHCKNIHWHVNTFGGDKNSNGTLYIFQSGVRVYWRWTE